MIPLAFLASCIAQVGDLCAEEYKNLQLTPKEIAFLDLVRKDSPSFPKVIVALLGIAEVANAPRTARELATSLAKSTVKTASADTFARAVRAIKQLSALPAKRHLDLFVVGKHQKFRGYRPRGQNLRFFRCLQQRYTKLAIGGRRR